MNQRSINLKKIRVPYPFRVLCEMGGIPCSAILFVLLFLVPSICAAQQLPNAPTANLITQATQQQAPISSQVPPPLPTPPKVALPAGPRLTLGEAEKMALARNPNISIARLLQLASTQVVREARSNDLPTATTDLTAVGAHYDSRLTGLGSLNSPRALDKAAAGITVDQLITDFGRTRNLIRNAKSNQQAQLENIRASADDITLTVDEAFYNALTAQKILLVAEQTVRTRQATGDQIGALTNQKLRSTLDLSLADVQVSQAQLLVLDAQNAMQTAMANLNAILGSEDNTHYDLVDESPQTRSRPRLTPKNWSNSPSARGPIWLHSTTSTPPPNSSPPPSTTCFAPPSPPLPPPAARLSATTSSSLPGMAPPEPTSPSPSSTALNTPPAPKKPISAPAPLPSKCATCAITSPATFAPPSSTPRSPSRRSA